jgi:hypothetical protein
MVSPELAGRLITFTEFMKLPPPASMADARNVQADPAGYRQPSQPLTVGRYYEHRVLLDGYHRAARLWKFGPDNTTLRGFVPL